MKELLSTVAAKKHWLTDSLFADSGETLLTWSKDKCKKRKLTGAELRFYRRALRVRDRVIDRHGVRKSIEKKQKKRTEKQQKAFRALRRLQTAAQFSLARSKVQDKRRHLQKRK